MDKKELEIRVEQLEQSNKQLKSKYWVLTNGTMYQFCGFKENCFCIVNRRMMNQKARTETEAISTIKAGEKE